MLSDASIVFTWSTPTILTPLPVTPDVSSEMPKRKQLKIRCGRKSYVWYLFPRRPGGAVNFSAPPRDFCRDSESD